MALPHRLKTLRDAPRQCIAHRPALRIPIHNSLYNIHRERAAQTRGCYVALCHVTTLMSLLIS